MPGKRRSTRVCESIDFATLLAIQIWETQDRVQSCAQSSLCWSFFPIPCPSQLILIPTAHLGVPLWRTNVSPITTAHRHQNLARAALTHDFSELEILGGVGRCVRVYVCGGGTVDTG